jgi:hypothetical protein
LTENPPLDELFLDAEHEPLDVSRQYRSGEFSMRCRVIAAALGGAISLAAPSAQAATFYEAKAKLSITLTTLGSATMTTEAEAIDFDVVSTGDIGSFSSATGDDVYTTARPAFTLDDGVPFVEGDNLTVVADAKGFTAATVTKPNTSEALAEFGGAITLTGPQGVSGKVVLTILYSLSTIATLDHPSRETAFASAQFTLDGVTRSIDTLIGGGPLADIDISETFDLTPGEERIIPFNLLVSGSATALPAPIPLPAAAPLLLAGLGALGLAARRRRG